MPLPNPTEDQIAISLVQYMSLKGLHFHHSPNETGQTPEARRRASRMKAQGTSPGYPDYTILIPARRYPNAKTRIMFLELKRRTGSKTTVEQKEWVQRLNEEGIPARICKGLDEAQAFIDEMTS